MNPINKVIQECDFKRDFSQQKEETRQNYDFQHFLATHPDVRRDWKEDQEDLRRLYS